MTVFLNRDIQVECQPNGQLPFGWFINGKPLRFPFPYITPHTNDLRILAIFCAEERNETEFRCTVIRDGTTIPSEKGVLLIQGMS